MNKVAPEGMVYVCAACGKRSKDRYGDQKIDRLWDASCMMHAVLCYENKKDEQGRWIAAPESEVDNGSKEPKSSS